MKVRSSSPFVVDLIRGALLLGNFALQLNWSGWEAEVDEKVVRDALMNARTLAGDEKLDAVSVANDEEPMNRLMSNCLGVSKQVNTLSDLVDLALQNFDKLEGCGGEDATKLAIMKTEYYENTKTPMMLSENDVKADALTATLAYAGLVWKLGEVKVGSRDSRTLLLIPVTLYEKAIDFLNKARGGKLLPTYVTYNWAFALWMAVNFDVKGVFKVLYVKKRKNRINVELSMTIDLKAEREALERVFENKFNSARGYLKAVLENVLSGTPDALAVRFVNALYQVAHHSMPPAELKNLGLREYASLLSAKSEIPPVVRQIGRVAELIEI